MEEILITLKKEFELRKELHEKSLKSMFDTSLQSYFEGRLDEADFAIEKIEELLKH